MRAPGMKGSRLASRLSGGSTPSCRPARTRTGTARALGYSTRTLSRASMDAAGVGAKEYIDRRVLLEAKRLLAHGDQPAAKIAARLGFSSATNFTKFFHQRTGTSPLAFRHAVRGTAV